MAKAEAGTKEHPWKLTTSGGASEFEAWRDATLTPPALVVKVGKTELRYHLSAIEDLHRMLRDHGDWMPLGGADEQKPAAEGTVEAWGRSPANSVGGWYGLKKGLRGRLPSISPRFCVNSGSPKSSRIRATIACARCSLFRRRQIPIELRDRPLQQILHMLRLTDRVTFARIHHQFRLHAQRLQRVPEFVDCGAGHSASLSPTTISVGVFTLRM